MVGWWPDCTTIYCPRSPYAYPDAFFVTMKTQHAVLDLAYPPLGWRRDLDLTVFDGGACFSP